MRVAFTLFIGWFVAIHLFELVVFPSMFHPNEVLSSVTLTQRFTLIWTNNADTAHYMAIAKNGYVGENAAFFPLWPLTIRVLGSSPVVAKIVASLFTFLFVILLGRLVSILGYSRIKEQVLLIFLAFPSSFLLLGTFSEPLFLPLTALTFILTEKKYIGFAAFVAALASATRPVGIVLTFYLALKIAQGGFPSLKKYWWTLLVSPLGLVFYALYLFLAFGDFTLFWTDQTAGWGRQIGLHSFPKLMLDSAEVVRQVFGPVKPPPINFLQVAVIPFTAFLGVLSFKKINKPMWIYSMLLILIPLSSGTYLASLREILAAFPLFIPFADFLAKRKTFLYLYLFLAILFQSLLLIRFFNFEWVA
ncbi:MAG: hypothetical protein AAB512_02140 [Patescibacteria group bacterium]